MNLENLRPKLLFKSYNTVKNGPTYATVLPCNNTFGIKQGEQTSPFLHANLDHEKRNFFFSDLKLKFGKFKTFKFKALKHKFKNKTF